MRDDITISIPPGSGKKLYPLKRECSVCASNIQFVYMIHYTKVTGEEPLEGEKYETIMITYPDGSTYRLLALLDSPVVIRSYCPDCHFDYCHTFTLRELQKLITE